MADAYRGGRTKPSDDEGILTCVICLDRPPVVAVVPCGHRCLCEHDAAAVMLYAHPWVYDWAQGAASDDDDGAATLPNVSAVIGGESKEGSITTAITAGWGELTLFGKSASLGEDMLNSLISPALDETLDSQARRRARRRLAHIARTYHR